MTNIRYDWNIPCLGNFKRANCEEGRLGVTPVQAQIAARLRHGGRQRDKPLLLQLPLLRH